MSGPKVPPWEKLALTVSEAAALLSMSERTVYDLVHTEAFPALRVGRTIRISRQRLEEWVKSQTGKEAVEL